MAPVTITRTHWVDDDGTGTTGTVINDAAKQEIYGQIDAALALVDAAAALPGKWTDVPYSAGNFTSDIGSFTVESGDVAVNQYTTINKTLIWQLTIATASVAGAPNGLRIALPAGVTLARGCGQLFGWSASDGTLYAQNVSGTVIEIKRAAGAAWSNTTNNTTFFGTIIAAIL